MIVFNVFCNSSGMFGNSVGIVDDIGKPIVTTKRQQMAKESGFSEIVFINDLEEKEISIFSPTKEIPFAGHAAVGTSYYLRYCHNLKFNRIKSMGAIIETWEEDGLTWAKTEPSALPEWNYKELKTPSEVESLTLDSTQDHKHTVVWSWLNKKKGQVRARTFAPDWDIPEDEANGSGSIRLANILKTDLKIHNGKGSIIFATPNSVGGLVKRNS